MIQLREVKKIFIDFDGVIVDSNKFKESAIKNSVYKLLGESKKNIEAVRYFNINAGISREKKLSLFFISEEVLKSNSNKRVQNICRVYQKQSQLHQTIYP